MLGLLNKIDKVNERSRISLFDIKCFLLRQNRKTTEHLVLVTGTLKFIKAETVDPPTWAIKKAHLISKPAVPEFMLPCPTMAICRLQWRNNSLQPLKLS